MNNVVIDYLKYFLKWDKSIREGICKGYPRHVFLYYYSFLQAHDHGIFGEMSIVELQERLALLKEAKKKAAEERRDMIIHEKYAKEQVILSKLEQISMFREQYGRAAALKLV